MARWQGADRLQLPGTCETLADRLARAQPLAGTPGQAYAERRGIPLGVAAAAALRYDADWDGRPAVLLGLHDRDGRLASVHGRYLCTLRGQDKMLTIGPGGGVAGVGEGWRAEPLVVVEGVFDALSLAVCGWSSIATIGRPVPWLPGACAGRVVWLAFDANRPGDDAAACWTQRLSAARVQRLRPPQRCKDWNTALLRLGRTEVARWLRASVGAGDTTAP